MSQFVRRVGIVGPPKAEEVTEDEGGEFGDMTGADRRRRARREQVRAFVRDVDETGAPSFTPLRAQAACYFDQELAHRVAECVRAAEVLRPGEEVRVFRARLPR